MSIYFQLYLVVLILELAVSFLKTNNQIFRNINKGFLQCSSTTVYYDDQLIKSCQKNYDNKSVLIVGDGDFSFSKVLAELINIKILKNTSLVATTLEDENSLNIKFPVATENIKTIVQTPNCKVEYFINGTDLPLYYYHLFDVVVFNFPHWNGKQNNRYNRNLLFNFLNNAKLVLRDNNSSILISLNENQSGAYVNTFLEWKETWQLTHYAAQAGLLLTSIDSFLNESFAQVGYIPTGRRGISSKFPVRAHIYRLQQPTKEIKAIQGPLYVHEIHLLSEKMHHDLYNFETFVRNEIISICKQIDMERSVWSINLVDVYICPSTNLVSHTFQIGYCSLSIALGRDSANRVKSYVELTLPGKVNMTLRESKKGLSVSQPFHWKLALKIYHESNDLEGKKNCDIVQLTHTLRKFENNNTQIKENESDDTISMVAKKLWKRRIGIKSSTSS